MNDRLAIAMTESIEQYFDGERREMFAILLCSLVAVAAVVALYAVARDGFAKGLGLTVVITAVLLSSMAASLLVRDGRHRAALLFDVRSANVHPAMENEAQRMAVVISKYAGYRYASAILCVIALAAALIARRGWVSGVCVGVLLLAVAQLTIDHYSEARARIYEQRLAAATTRH